ncbi:MAG: zinc ribbon domain-containing protein [Methanobrevibacter sp.]|jgi:uncharacterized membrane protein YvbJ|nr:zinc ribbon domain-containing protein [Candidatus Methanoflexus mossambicus]
MTKYFCKNCGNLLSKDDKFCEKCGNKVSEEITQNSANNLNLRSSKDISTSKKFNKILTFLRGNKKISVLISCLVVFLIVILLSSGIFFSNDNNSINNHKKITFNDVYVNFDTSEVSAEYSSTGNAYTSYSWRVYAYSSGGNASTIGEYSAVCKFYDENDNLVDSSDNSLYLGFDGVKVSLGYLTSKTKYNIVKVLVEIRDRSGKITQEFNQTVETSLE